MIAILLSLIGGTAVIIGTIWSMFLMYDGDWGRVPVPILLVALGLYLLEKV